MSCRLISLLTAALVLLSSYSAAKPSKEQVSAARALAYAGYELMQEQKWAEAYDRFYNAERIFHAPPHVLYMAQCKRELGELVAARKYYQQLLDDTLDARAPREFRKAQEDAGKELDELKPRIPSLAITVSGPTIESATILVDDQDVSETARQGAVEVDPGERTVRVTAEGYEPAETTVNVPEGAEVHAVELTLTLVPPQPTPKPTPPADRSPTPPPTADGEEGSLVPGFVVGGVGVALVGVGIITGVLALDKADELKTNCPVRADCPAENEALEDDARVLGTVSTVGFIAGGAAVAGGAVLLLLRPGGGSDEPDAEAAGWTVEPVLAPGVVGLRGTF